MFFKSLIGTFLHPQGSPYDLPLSYWEIGPRVIVSLELIRPGLTITRTLMNILSRFPCSYREFSPSRNRYLRGRESLTSRIPDSRFAMVLSASLSSLRITLSHVTCWSTRPRSFPLSEVQNCEMGMCKTYPLGTSDSLIPDATSC